MDLTSLIESTCMIVAMYDKLFKLLSLSNPAFFMLKVLSLLGNNL